MARGAPHQSRVLVEEARKDLPRPCSRLSSNVEKYVGDEESGVVVRSKIREIVDGLKEPQLVAGCVTQRLEAGRIRLRAPGRPDLCSAIDKRSELSCDLHLRQLVRLDSSHDSGLEHRTPSSGSVLVGRWSLLEGARSRTCAHSRGRPESV